MMLSRQSVIRGYNKSPWLRAWPYTLRVTFSCTIWRFKWKSPWYTPALSRVTELWVNPEGSPELRKVKGSFTTDFNGIKISSSRNIKASASLTEMQKSVNTVGQCLWISVRHLILCLIKACYKYRLTLTKTGTLLHWLKAAGKWQWIKLGRSVCDNSSQTFLLYPRGKHSLCLHTKRNTAKGHFPPTKARGTLP